MSKSFDNGMVCASEQAVIIDKEIYDEFVEEFKSYHTLLSTKEKALLEEFCFGVKANSKNCAVQIECGHRWKPAAWIAEQAGSQFQKEPISLRQNVKKLVKKNR